MSEKHNNCRYIFVVVFVSAEAAYIVITKTRCKMNNFETHIQGSLPVVVDFFADWCGPCKMMPPILKEVKEKTGDRATILKMDVDKNRHYAEKYGIQSIPTLIIFKGGQIIWRKSGVSSANEILQHLAAHLV